MTGGVFGIGETLTYAAQRVLMSHHSLAREFSRSEISKVATVNGDPYDTGFTDKPTLRRIRVGQTPSEFVLDLKGVHRYTDPVIGSWTGLAPDGSPLGVLDLSTQEVYALELEPQ